MAKLVLTNANISINATDVSSSVASVQIETTVDEVETTSFGPGNGKTRVGGLLDGFQDRQDAHGDAPDGRGFHRTTECGLCR